MNKYLFASLVVFPLGCAAFAYLCCELVGAIFSWVGLTGPVSLILATMFGLYLAYRILRRVIYFDALLLLCIGLLLSFVREEAH